MEDIVDPNVLSWYRQFVHEKAESDDHTRANFLNRISDVDVDNFSIEFGNIIPEIYINFLKSAGSGRIRQDIHGNTNELYDNYFMNTSEIAEIIKRSSPQWEIYPDFIASDEIPFFFVDENSVLVFKKGKGSKVYYPHLEDVYAENLGEFLKKLMDNINFYSEL